MTYDEALAFWYGRTNYEVRSAGPLDLKLERMRALLRRLGDPHDRLRLVHVTGTKGKGSTCAMLAAVLRAAGYRVGLFTSPHLEHVEERVQVDGAPIAHAELAARMAEIAPAVRAMDAEAQLPPPTFFEIGTALGFLHFVYRRCNICLIEVGLGGRFDSTNVCRPLVSVVTNVGLDHTAQLGNTLEAIAYQKAGIIKRRVPVVSGVTQEGPREWCAGWRRNWGRRCIGRAGGASPPSGRARLASWARTSGRTRRSRWRRSTGCATAGMHVPPAAVARGLAEVRWPARVEVIRERPAVILDTAHNVPSAEALVDTLRETFPGAGARRVVFAVSSDKPWADMLRVLAGYFTHFHLTKYSNNPRGVPPEKLAAALAELAPGAAFSAHPTAPEAWRAARAALSEADLVCVTGSVFLAGELRSLVTG
jgi:dihydrofolate synthase/folylpolyglutamate synthase